MHATVVQFVLRILMHEEDMSSACIFQQRKWGFQELFSSAFLGSPTL